MDKPLLRRQLRRNRNQILGHMRKWYDAMIARRLQRLLPLRRARYVGGYIAFDGEPNLANWMNGRIDDIWLPVINRQLALDFRPAPKALSRHKLRLNRFGIPEPTSGANRTAGKLDALLIPLVGFDDLGNRLGMGAGFYDRSLAGIGQPRPILIGIAFECQRVDRLPADPWDVPLDYVVTERTIHQCRIRRQQQNHDTGRSA